jgi:aryl-alcohol dehydrogenase-like predicted oxidoreductase
MEYRKLGPSGCLVSSFALGTMTFGVETDEKDAHRQLDHFTGSGGNLIDTANVYGAGKAEEIIGSWLATKSPRAREQLVIASKGRFEAGDGPYRIQTIMSNHTPPTCGVLADEQCDSAVDPDDHEQSGAVAEGPEARPG